MKALIPMAAAVAVLGSQVLAGVAVAAPSLGTGTGTSATDQGIKFVNCQNQSTFSLVDVPATLAAVATVVTPDFIGGIAIGPGPTQVSTASTNSPSNNTCS
ncbi:hypothetical protein [Streptomyces sp. NPDC046727]|uniref:hypothetical protein n=1 Tax=Streptomyces sp. NPDC046727 TaxID=3155373 RepID=UPI0033EF8B56